MTVEAHRDPPASSGLTAARESGGIDALEQLGRSFKGAMAAVRRLRGRETHRPGELSFAQYSLMFGLVDGGQKSVRELAFAADLSPASVTQMLENLAGVGLVERVRSKDDKRVVLTSLTERGDALLSERRARLQPRWRNALAEFSDDELRTAAVVLDRLRDAFYDMADSEQEAEGPQGAANAD
jgi:MarR family transcriptional regulator, organic hydroperoxide resistance regulator